MTINTYNSNKKFSGKIYYCEDYTNTDVIAPGRYDPIEGEENLARIALIDYQSETPFVDQSIGRSCFKIIVAGRDFGCGSSRETAPLALHAAGIRVIVAKTFARIFYRNCINMGGIFPLVINHDWDETVLGKIGDFDFDSRKFSIDGKSYCFDDFGPLREIIELGGLANYTRMKFRGEKCP